MALGCLSVYRQPGLASCLTLFARNEGLVASLRKVHQVPAIMAGRLIDDDGPWGEGRVDRPEVGPLIVDHLLSLVEGIDLGGGASLDRAHPGGDVEPQHFL